jgi:hypothetical protein
MRKVAAERCCEQTQNRTAIEAGSELAQLASGSATKKPEVSSITGQLPAGAAFCTTASSSVPPLDSPAETCPSSSGHIIRRTHGTHRRRGEGARRRRRR